MKIKIAVYNDPVVNLLFGNSGSVPEVEIFKTDEKSALDLLINLKVDCALLNPQTYSLATGKSDLRIIPSPMIISNGFTRIMSLFFKENLHEFLTCAVPKASGYLTQIFKILLHERYDMQPEFIEDAGELSELLGKYDAAVIKGSLDDNENCLDLGEDWLQTYEIPLVTAFWAVRNEEVPEGIEQILLKISDGGLSPINFNGAGENEYDREGKIERKFNDEVIESLEHVLHLLYYKQLTDKIPEIKIFGINAEL